MAMLVLVIAMAASLVGGDTLTDVSAEHVPRSAHGESAQMRLMRREAIHMHSKPVLGQVTNNDENQLFGKKAKLQAENDETGKDTERGEEKEEQTQLGKLEMSAAEETEEGLAVDDDDRDLDLTATSNVKVAAMHTSDVEDGQQVEPGALVKVMDNAVSSMSFGEEEDEEDKTSQRDFLSFRGEQKKVVQGFQTTWLAITQPFTPAKSKEIGTIQANKEYVLEFDITPQGTTSSWGSILHFGASNSERIPALWFYPGAHGLKLCVRSGRSGSHNAGCDPAERLVKDTKTTVKIVCAHDKLEVFFNNVLKCSTSHPNPLSPGLATIYSGDPWYDPAKAEIHRMTYWRKDDAVLPNMTIAHER